MIKNQTFGTDKLNIITKIAILQIHQKLQYLDRIGLKLVNIFDFGRFITDSFEYKPLDMMDSIYMIVTEELHNVWNNTLFHKDPETPTPCVEHYLQSVINGNLLMIDDSLFTDYWKQY